MATLTLVGATEVLLPVVIERGGVDSTIEVGVGIFTAKSTATKGIAADTSIETGYEISITVSNAILQGKPCRLISVGST